ncbi:hypothetical protein E2562_008883 [Oryza meyeriana var. granulata]|uniref:Uncharacterized protein n=1 Tax=Oryza meyeriana var. granulata TaxID=110450 RepID=A0A6G1CZG1_9ORYZ|nr:hypothetical protein E2562_008883 [Oryza meyeriana var. granulata]
MTQGREMVRRAVAEGSSSGTYSTVPVPVKATSGGERPSAMEAITGSSSAVYPLRLLCNWDKPSCWADASGPNN